MKAETDRIVEVNLELRNGTAHPARRTPTGRYRGRVT